MEMGHMPAYGGITASLSKAEKPRIHSDTLLCAPQTKSTEVQCDERRHFPQVTFMEEV